MSLASKVKSLVSKPASPQKCSIFGQEQHSFFDLLKMGHDHDLFFLRFGACQRPRRNFMKTFFFFGERPKFCGKVGINLRENLLCFIGERLNFAKNLKFFCAKTYLFGEHLHVVFLVLGLEIVCRQEVGPCPRIFFVSLAFSSSLVSSTPPLLITYDNIKKAKKALLIYHKCVVL